MKISPLILARGGSKGVPNKNIKELCGKPLLAYVLEEALKVFPEVFVSTEDERIAFIVTHYGGTVLWRPKELAQDDSKSIDVVKHHLPELKGDAVLLINACCPLTLSSDIENSVKIMEETGCDSVVSLVEDFSAHPSKVCRLIEGGKVFEYDKHPYREKNCAGCIACKVDSIEWFKTGERQKQNPIYKRNTAIYLAKREVIESGTFFGKDCRGFIMPQNRSWDINDQLDWNIVEFLIKKNAETNQKSSIG